MAARILSVPYVVAREAEGMGAGPLALAQVAASALATDDVRRLALTAPRTTEVAACFDLNRQLAREVAAARGRRLARVLTGNCHSQQAVVAGLGSDDLGLVWLDCHGDFNTPETTETGYFDGFALAMVVGGESAGVTEGPEPGGRDGRPARLADGSAQRDRSSSAS